MKKSLLSVFLFLGMIGAKAQLPTILTTTIIPASPTPSDNVKIVTKVSTPNQGIVVDSQVFTVSHSTKVIKLNNCYWQGMLTAIQTHIDTFMVGQLQAGTYAIKHKPYMSSTQQHCTKIDSNEVVATITVAAATSTVATGIKDIESENLMLYPNPVKNKLYFENAGTYTEALIYQLEGWLVDVVAIDRNGELNVEGLSKGLYFVRFSNGDRSKTIKFIKE